MDAEFGSVAERAIKSRIGPQAFVVVGGFGRRPSIEILAQTDDSHAPIFAKREQSMISRDDRLSATGDRAFQDAIIGLVLDHLWFSSGPDREGEAGQEHGDWASSSASRENLRARMPSSSSKMGLEITSWSCSSITHRNAASPRPPGKTRAETRMLLISRKHPGFAAFQHTAAIESACRFQPTFLTPRKPSNLANIGTART